MSATSLVIKRGHTSDNEQSEHGRQEDPGEIIASDDRKILHLLPCKIHPHKTITNSQTITAPVDRYFRPYTKDRADANNDSADTTLWHASLRGKPLTGVKLDLPEGYVGVLCRSNNGEVNSTDSKAPVNFIADDKDGDVNQEMMYWNWDRVPTREDPLLAALNWIHVSEAIMSNNH